MTLLDIALYFAAAFVGSAINSVAGGGTFLTFPVLILGGLTASQANIMSTIALWPGSVASALAYRGQLQVARSLLSRFVVVSVAGSAIGTFTFLYTPEAVFAWLVPWLLLVATLIFTFGGRVRIAKADMATTHGFVAQFFIAVYGGYFGAGIGILMLAMLQWLGLSHIHQMNALKTVLGSAINAVAVLIFVLSGSVLWPVAAVMIAGAVCGGVIGAKIALRVSPRIVRSLVIATGFATSAYFFLYGM